MYAMYTYYNNIYINVISLYTNPLGYKYSNMFLCVFYVRLGVHQIYIVNSQKIRVD